MQNNNKQRKQPVIKQDAPVFRSVMMAPSSASASLGGVPPPMPMSMPLRQSPVSPKMPMPMPKSMPFGGAPLRREGPSPSMENALPSPMGFGKSTPSRKQAAVTEDSWNVTELISVPGFHILERTHVYVAEATPVQVASRISACFKEQSVAAKYDSAKACAYAETEDQVEFVVRLFQHSASKILVEVQKVMGCSFGFCQIAKTVLNAAKGNAKMESIQSRMTLPPLSPALQAKLVKRDQDEVVDECLEHANTLLKSKRLDSDLLAMESLSHITSNSCPDQACAAEKILCGPVLDALSRLIKCVDESDDGSCSNIRRKALAVLANCLELVEKCEKLTSIMEQKQGVQCEELLSFLVNELNMASMKPHEACQAARCLQPLIRSCPRIRQKCQSSELNMTSAVTSAARTGSSSHFLLETQSLQLRELLLRN